MPGRRWRLRYASVRLSCFPGRPGAEDFPLPPIEDVPGSCYRIPPFSSIQLVSPFPDASIVKSTRRGRQTVTSSLEAQDDDARVWARLSLVCKTWRDALRGGLPPQADPAPGLTSTLNSTRSCVLPRHGHRQNCTGIWFSTPHFRAHAGMCLGTQSHPHSRAIL